MTKRFWKAICALCLVPVILTGCWQEDPNEQDILPIPEEETEPQDTGARTVLPESFALPYVPGQSLDPVACPDGMQQVVASLLCEGLFRLDETLEPQPWLCSSYTYDSTALTYVFTLRGGVTFSDGSALTAADVKATLDRARTSERYRARLSAVSAVSAGDGTVTVVLSQPNTGLPALLDIPIVKAGTQGAAPIGTGPYLFSDSGSAPCLVANQLWWKGDSQPMDRILLVEAADRDTMLYRFTSHDVQLITVDLTSTDSITATGNISYRDADTTILHYLVCNTTRAPLDSAAFRKALSLGINRATVVSAFLSGHGAAAQFPVSPRSPLYPQSLEAAYSADSFNQALATSGYTAGRRLTLLVNAENSFKVSIAQHLAESFTASGVPMEAKALPWADYTAALDAGNFDLYYGEVKLSADWDLTALLATGGALNYGGWADTRTDQLLTLYAAAPDRAVAMKSLCSYLQLQAPILPICFKSTSVLMQSGVLEGITPTMAEPFYNLPACTVRLREE